MPLKLFSEKEKAPSSLSKIKKVIAIAAGKGGVGKSTIAVNLALALKKEGFKVGLLDADVYGPSVKKMLPEGLLPCQSEEDPSRITPGLSLGIPFISVAHFKGEKEASLVRAPIANGVIQQFLHQVNWGDLDFLLIDFPPGTGDIQLTIAQQAGLSGALVVTTPQEVALLDVRKAIQLFLQLNIPILGIVENMSYLSIPHSEEKVYPFGKGGGERLAKEFGVPLFGEIPLDAELCRCGDEGKSLFQTDSVCAALFSGIIKKFISSLPTSGEEIKEMIQSNPYTFTIEWIDGKISAYRFSDLQRRCPCARCEGKKGEGEMEQKEVEVTAIKRIGKYGLSFAFTSGCSKGIYPYSFLRKWGLSL